MLKNKKEGKRLARRKLKYFNAYRKQLSMYRIQSSGRQRNYFTDNEEYF